MPLRAWFIPVTALVTILRLSAANRALGQVPPVQPSTSISGVIRDSASGAPIPGATVSALRGNATVASTRSDSAGRYRLELPRPRSYVLNVRRLGYRPSRETVTIPPHGPVPAADLVLVALPTTLEAVVVTARAPVAIDLKSGDQTYHQLAAPTAPTVTTSQLVQQAVAGAARAPMGEVHIRGQHGEFTYYVDGVPVASGISGSLNELFDPAVADRIDFQTGGWDAEYGNKNIAVIKVATRIPEGGLHVRASGYEGSFGSAGQTLTGSTHAGPLGLLVSATHQTTDMRREPLMQNGATGSPLNFHNHGTDDFLFGKLNYAPSNADELVVDFNASRTNFEVPFDSTGGAIEDDHQRDLNAFLNIGIRHRFGPRASSVSATRPAELFAGVYLRRGSLTYAPGAADQPQFLFYPDTTIRYSVSEDRSATTTGIKADYGVALTSVVQVKMGIDAALVSGREHFETRDSLGRPGRPGVNGPVHGGDAAAFLQSVITPSPQWEFRLGLRLDHHIAPLAGDAHQLSPRFRIGYFPSSSTSVWAYYGRLFIPSNVEDFHVLAAAAQSGGTGRPTYPERDHYFEAGLVQRLAEGVLVKLAGYYRNDSPAVDDNALPGTAVTTTVNIAQVHVAGVESVLELHPAGPFSGYVNAALSHATAHGPITGGFLPTAYPHGWFDQDHDQRLSIVANGEYRLGAGYLSATGIFGSGLTNGHPEAAPNKTGLFDFNSAVKVAPGFIVNTNAGLQLKLGETTVRPELFITNLFNLHYVLKGAFTSGPSVGRPRAVQLRVSIGR